MDVQILKASANSPKTIPAGAKVYQSGGHDGDSCLQEPQRLLE
eukprot:CAMPEP_0197869688 /NCGR_PEP_ID=MMETSP1439-20131203/519_1 /TAXON_ID=66791 /ORGANISM="Gonyaulax spinifera, Strain CCMP409" /LENGTH=42 /DNA_ID= /DNA_START= /DNA_END= /DNA_ORIENTATION=